MAGETVITVVGNLTDDPELRFTPSGAAVANFTVASTPAHVRPADQRVEGRRDAVPALLGLAPGGGERRRVAASAACASSCPGRLKPRSYETKEGEKRTVVEIEVDEVGPRLRYATAKVTKTQRGGGGGGGGGRRRRRPVAAGGWRRRPGGGGQGYGGAQRPLRRARRPAGGGQRRRLAAAACAGGHRRARRSDRRPAAG